MTDAATDLESRPRRVCVEGVTPEVDAGRFPIKRVAGELVVVEADLFAEGHDLVTGSVLHRRAGEDEWREARMEPLGNDRYRASFEVAETGAYEYTVEGWVDDFATWRRGLGKKFDAGQDVEVELQVGAELVRGTATRARDGREERQRLEEAARRLAAKRLPQPERVEIARSDELLELVERHPDRHARTRHARALRVVVDRERARTSAWYELFPRSTGPDGRHGTFRDAERVLPYVAELGFDVVYLPPVHPIGRTKRKGRNNRPSAEPGDVGSPWAIGAAEGGHKSVHPELGTLEDFRRFREKAEELGLEVALDVAFQCTPDHPYVVEHPDWFRHRPDGSIQYAENPPKKYEDIYPFDFECEDWRGLWEELRSVFLFWIEQGVKIFRVDNPHTKPFPFWEWCIAEVKARHPEALFLSEAFTRPKIMYRLAKLGFTQSYTYFAWKNTKWEYEQYLRELFETGVREYFRPSFWPNTPDILNEYLQLGGRPAFMTRIVLAATSTASYGIYGPAFELMEASPREPGSEEYLDSEKYQVRSWDLDRPGSLRAFVGRVNRIRRANPALHTNEGFALHRIDNESMVCYSKATRDLSNVVLVVVNLDPRWKHAGWIELDLEALGLEEDEQYQVHDMLRDARFLWTGRRNYVELDPQEAPAHVFRVTRRHRTERDFEHYIG